MGIFGWIWANLLAVTVGIIIGNNWECFFNF